MKVNAPELWDVPKPGQADHKYSRGMAVIYGAPLMTGATRLAASAAARAGAGLVTVLAPPGTGSIYRISLPAHIIVRDDMQWYDPRITAQLWGPGGLDVKIMLAGVTPAVIDADGLFALPEKLHENVVLTPHEGEFLRLFPDFKGKKTEKALMASQKSGAIVVLKGAESIIAHPDGRIVVNNHASSYLASAGTGDVMAGMIAGLLAQGMEPFDAACAGVWMHGEAGIRLGAGLVASDIPDILPLILRNFA